MIASDFRSWGREYLRGHWFVAVLVSLIGGILGGGVDLMSGVNAGPTVEINASALTGDRVLFSELFEVQSGNVGLLDFIPRDIWAMLVTVTIVTALLAIVIGGTVQLGICTFHLNLIKRQEARFGDLFSQFHRLWQGFCMQFVMGFFVLLWSLLFIIPGVVATYRYAMVPYLMAEFPELRVMDAMKESKRLMMGNKWRLFCLHFSFIGWNFVAAMTMGIGSLWVAPYQSAADTAFYMEVTGRGGLRYQEQKPNYLEF